MTKGGNEHMETVYIIEDDESIRNMLTYALKQAGFLARGFACGQDFWEDAALTPPSLIVLDIMLPGEDGIAILQRLKQSGKLARVPVVMLTAKSSEYDRVTGLDSGADDYITKPFSVLELLSRVRAVLRRSTSDIPREAVLRVGGIALHTQKRTVHAEGVEIPCTYKEFELLHYLMLNEGIVLSRERLIEQVWGFDYDGESRTVDMHIKGLRHKLGEEGSHIKTVRNVGYKLEA